MKLARTFRVALLVLVVLQTSSEMQPFRNRVRAASGDLLWERQLSIGFYTAPVKVVVEGQQLIVVGVTESDGYAEGYNVKNLWKLFVAAYDLNTGAGGLVWSDVIGGADGLSSTGLSGSLLLTYTAITLAPGRPAVVRNGQDLFVAVQSYFPIDMPESPDRTFLRKYDLLHGTLLWEQEVFGPSSAKWVQSGSLAVSGPRVFVSGSTGPFLGDGDNSKNPQAFTRAYNASNGHVSWSVKSPVGSGAGASVAGGNLVFVVLGLGNSQVLRAYDVSTGAKVWERTIDPKKSVGPMRVNSNQLFLAGSTNTGGSYGADFFVQSDGVDTGALLWESSPRNAGNDGANDIVVADQKVFTGGAETNAAGGQDFMVRTYDALTGRLLWKSLVDKGGNDTANAVAVNSSTGKVFAVGSGETAIPDYDDGSTGRYLVRAYNLKTGALTWEDFRPSPSPMGEAATHAVVAGQRLLTAGVTNLFLIEGEDPTFADLVIRAYDAQ